MSDLKSTSDATTKLDFDQVIVEICANDVRTASGINNVENIFQNNVQLLNKYDEEMRLIFLFQKVKCHFNIVINTFNELFKEAVNIDEKTKNNFFEVLPFVSRDCTSIDGNFSSVCETMLKPFCLCDIRDKDGSHLLYSCNLKGYGGISREEKNKIIIATIIECTDDIFKDKVINGLKPFKNPDVGILVGSALTTSANRDKLTNFNSAAWVFYDNLAEMFRYKTYKQFTDDEKRDFHFCLVELILLIYDNEGLNEVHAFFKKNVKKLGMNYYIQLMWRLVMAGRYGINNFLNKILEIVSLETIWLNDIDELPNVKVIFSKLLFFSRVYDINERENILKNLKKLGEYIKITDFISLMFIFKDKRICCYGTDSVKLIDNFYKTLRKIYDDTLKNGLKKN